MHSPYVTTLPQTYFTEEQKAQARENIDVQQSLTAGDNIQINGSTISATDTKYTAGTNVSINSSNVISATDTKYTAGNGLNLNGTEFSADTTVLQEKLTAGSNVQINNNVISATDTKYTAGSNVQISNANVISATDTKYTAGSNISIDANNVISASIPTVNDGNLKFQLGSATATKVFSANQASESTIVVPNRTYSVNGSTTTYGAGLPTLEDMQAIYSQADWAQTDNTKVDFVKNKPTIPAAANDGTLTITQGTTTLGTFTANQSGNSSIAIPVPPHVPVQYYHAVNFLSFPITSNTSYSTYRYNYPAALDKTKDYIVTFSVNLSQPSGETWSLNNADIPYHFNIDTTGSFSVADTTGVMTNLGGRSLYASSLSCTVKIPKTYMSGENLNFLIYFPPNTLTTSNTVELGYKVYYQEFIA